MTLKSLQFELWQECNSHCTYCYLGKENRCTPVELKLNSLHTALEKISDLSNYPETEVISFLGGEFFQGQLNTPEVREGFYKLIEKVNWLLENNYIKEFWIYATMTIGDQKDLYQMIDMISDKSKMWILTSYDTIGRFHSQKMFDSWDYNMRHIHELYPEIRLNTTTIITGDLIEKYLNDEFSFKDFIEKYHTSMFFKQCGRGPYTKEEMNEQVGNFFPKREEFLKFLIKFKEQEDEYLWDKLFNIKYRADSLYRNFNDKDRQMQLEHRIKTGKMETDNENDMAVNKCGHLLTYAAYIDSDGCVLCDKKNVAEM